MSENNNVCVPERKNISYTWEPSPLFKGDNTFGALTDFRSEIYNGLGERRDASMDLIDALACQENAKSPTELSLQPQFTRKYSSVRDGIHYASNSLDAIKGVLQTGGINSLYRLKINTQKYVLMAVDSTPSPHPYADCLADRTIVHDSSNGVTGRPINIGHEYSAVVGITSDSNWVSPIRFDRVPSTESPAQFGVKQSIQVCQQLSNERPIVLMDSRYNNIPCRQIVREAKRSENDPIYIVRSPCNRHYHTVAPEKIGKGGRPRQYGEVINIYQPLMGPKPDGHIIIVPNDGKGALGIFFWKEIYTKQQGGKGYEDPSSLLVIFELKADGTPKYRKPLVLRIFIPDKCIFNPCDSGWIYFLRFAVEHFF